MKKLLSVGEMSRRPLARTSMAISAALMMLAVAGCSSTDVVAKYANRSFKALVEASDGRVHWSDDEQSWILASPAGDEISFSSDFARNNSTDGSDPGKSDIGFSFDAAPFLAAGLDIAKLPPADGIKYELRDGRFLYRFELGNDRFSPDARESPEATFAEIIKTERARISYHEKLDHYGIKLGGGNMLEWAKDTAKNDKDLVFVLDPAPFVAAGLDATKIEGWTFAAVETRDDAGKTVFVDKLLRPFDLE